MSWLDERLEAPRARRPFPVDALAVRLGIPRDDATLVARLALRLDMDAGWVHRCRRLGLTLGQADEWATRVGLHPANVWPAYARELYGAALANANRLTCRCGRCYDLVDSYGFRRCSVCWREAKRRHKKSVNVQVTALFSRTRVHARHQQFTVAVMDAKETPGSDWLTVREVAEALRVNTRAVYEACSRGELPHTRVGRVIRVHVSAITPSSAPRVAS